MTLKVTVLLTVFLDCDMATTSDAGASAATDMMPGHMNAQAAAMMSIDFFIFQIIPFIQIYVYFHKV